jgi:hypothetical protein
MDEVKKACPYAFAVEPTNPGVSGKYIQANTETVIKDLEKLGWYPVQAKQCRAKKGSKGIRSFHIVAFQHDDVKIVNSKGEDEAYVRIVLQNSHDGFNSFRFMMGCYRMVCSNGCILSDAEFADFSIRHINYSFEELRGIVARVMERIPAMVNSINKMNSTILTNAQKQEMAVETLKIRKGLSKEDRIIVNNETINELLTPIRQEDEGNSLWNVFNVLQEKMIKGTFFAPGKNGKNRKQRPITSIKKDLDYNQRLWEVASQYMAAA